jgi:mannose-6-phosphate isomerase
MTEPIRQKHDHKHGALNIGQTTPLKTAVWHTRRTLRNVLRRDVLDADKDHAVRRRRMRHVYRKVDDFVAAFFPRMIKTTSRRVALKRVEDMIDELGYTVVETDTTKPWGGFYRLKDEEAGKFIAEFFPGLTMKEAMLGQTDAKLSPKFLLVAPGQRLSWQYHHRRAERWHFLMKGAYYKSMTDKQGRRVEAPAGTIVQFAQGERHRLTSFDDDSYTLVAEIWQHTEPEHVSDESDIVRLADDYSR